MDRNRPNSRNRLTREEEEQVVQDMIAEARAFADSIGVTTEELCDELFLTSENFKAKWHPEE